MQSTIRPETPDDTAAIYEVVAAAFEHTAEANLVEAIRASPNYIPELSLVALANRTVVGHVMINWGVLRTARTNRPIAMLSPLAVHPNHQRKGFGGRLVTRVCAAADERGMPLVVLEGDPGYYGRFGFEPAYEYGIEMPLPDWAPREAGQILTLASYDPGLVGRVVYPAYFAKAEAERDG